MSRMMQQHRLAAQKRKASGTTDFQTDRDLEISQPGTDDVRVAAKTAGASKGKFLSLFQTPKNTLELIPTHSSIAEFVNDHADHLGDDILALVDPKGEKNPNGFPRHDVWGDKQVLQELLDDHLGTGWHWLEPKDIGQLTDAPILEAPDGRIYYHNDYHRQSGSDELLQGKTVKFDGAPENRTPASASVEEAVEAMPGKETPVKEASAKKAAEPLDETEPKIDPIPAVAPPVPPPTPSTGGNPYQDWKTENLIETIESLTDSDSFAQDKPEQKAVEQMAEVLSARPVEAEPVELGKKAALRKAAALRRVLGSTVSDLRRSFNKFMDEEGKEDEHKKAAVTPGGAFSAVDKDNAVILEGDKSIPQGRAFEEDNTGIHPPEGESARKFAGINDPAENADTSSVLEGDHTIPEGKDEEDDNTGVDVPSTDLPEKFASGYEELGVKTAAAPITAPKALSLIADLTEELKALYMDAKPITTVNESRGVREAVEAIYHAMKALGNAQKIIAKQQKQEEDEAEAVKVNEAKGKKSSFFSIANLKIAAVEVEAAPAKTQSRIATAKDRSTFRSTVSKHSSLAQEASAEIGDAIMRSASAYGIAHRACAEAGIDEEKKEAFEKKKAHLKGKITALATQLGLTASFEDGGANTVMLNIASGDPIAVPTS